MCGAGVLRVSTARVYLCVLVCLYLAECNHHANARARVCGGGGMCLVCLDAVHVKGAGVAKGLVKEWGRCRFIFNRAVYKYS